MIETTFAAAVYSRDLQDRDALSDFAAELRGAGVRVGGLVQEVLRDADGTMTGIDMVELDTGEKAIVFHNSSHPGKAERPKVKLVTDAQGNRIKPKIVDLIDRGESGFSRSIKRTMNAVTNGVNVPNVMLT